MNLVSVVAAALILVPTVAAAERLKIERSEPPKSHRFERGGEPVELTIAIRSDVDSSEGDQIALGVHDQRDRPLMIRGQPIVRVKQGKEVTIFKPTIKSLAPDVTEVVVEAVLIGATRSGRQPAMGERFNVKLTYKVK